MLAIVGLLTILVLMFLIMTKKCSTLVALIAVPMIACVIVGQGADMGGYITAGIKSVAATGVMFIFAVAFFGVMGDVGAFEIVVNKILRIIGKDPLKICIGTLIITLMTHLDGSGATTFLITIPALLPIYDKLKMDRRVLATIVAAGAGTMNLVPWGGPTIRAATALEVSLTELYNPMIVPQLCGVAACVTVAVMFGLKERKRLKGTLESVSVEPPKFEDLPEEERVKRRPHLVWFNILLIIVTIVSLVMELLPPAGCFMAALCIAMLVNYRDLKDQGKRMDEHAVAAMMMASTLFGAGCFTGILGGCGMLEAMAQGLCDILPVAIMGHIAILVAVFSMPLSLMFDPDSFYYAVLPVIAVAAEVAGVPALAVGRAAICGQITVGFPISPLTPSTFLLTGLTGVDLGDHQKHSFVWLWLISLTIVLVAVVMGVIPV